MPEHIMQQQLHYCATEEYSDHNKVKSYTYCRCSTLYLCFTSLTYFCFLQHFLWSPLCFVYINVYVTCQCINTFHSTPTTISTRLYFNRLIPPFNMVHYYCLSYGNNASSSCFVSSVKWPFNRKYLFTSRHC